MVFLNMPGYSLNESMLSGFFDARKVSPSPPEIWPGEVPNADSSARQISAGKCIPFYCGKHKAACKPTSQSQASRLLSGFGKESDEASNCSTKNGSDDSESDLAVMVYDFIENGSGSQEASGVAPAENGAAAILKLNETLQGLASSISSPERDLLCSVYQVLMNVNETDLVCQSSRASCNGSCIRHLVVKSLKCSGYNASLCKIEWNNSGRVPGGQYEYIDIIMPDRNPDPADRIIIDTDFRTQFEIARPVPQYQATLKLLPAIFIGKAAKLEQLLQIVSKAAKCSLNQNSMPLPPWRTLEYMKAKWFSAYERCSTTGSGGDRDLVIAKRTEAVSENKRCKEQLSHLRTFLKKETDTGFTALKSISNRGKIFGRAKPSRWSLAS